jgi:hypothetical protein
MSNTVAVDNLDYSLPRSLAHLKDPHTAAYVCYRVPCQDTREIPKHNRPLSMI